MQGLGEKGASLRIEMPPEGQAVADRVLPQPRLRLMHAYGNRVSYRKSVGRWVKPLFVEGMADLVQDAEPAVAKLMKIKPCGNAEIVGTEAGKEGVWTGIEASAPAVEADRGCYRFTELSLLIERINPLEDGKVRSVRRSANGRDEIKQLAAQG